MFLSLSNPAAHANVNEARQPATEQAAQGDRLPRSEGPVLTLARVITQGRPARQLTRLMGIFVVVLGASLGHVAQAQVSEWRPVALDSAQGAALVEQLRQGGLILYFRHADTRGMACDRSYRIGDRAGQRNLSEHGRRQSQAIGAALEQLGIPVAEPVLAGPVYRARDTAELAFGVQRVRITDSLLADDYAGGRLGWVLDEHRRLMGQAPPPGQNQVLVGHRTPAIMTLGARVGGRAFPEGAALVLRPRAAMPPDLLGILVLAAPDGDGFHAC